MKNPPLYLASQSPRRLQLLEQMGVHPQLLLPDESEDAEALEAPLSGEHPQDYVIRVTQLKWKAASARRQRRGWEEAPILCSDTTVTLRRVIMGKPVSENEAIQMLMSLSGQTHEVLTAVAVGRLRRPTVMLSRSKVTFRPLSRAEVVRYVESGEPMGKAGAYAIQGSAQRWISEIKGSYSGIMGLPLFETDQLLRRFRVIA
jgi:septum formation protein